MKSILQLFRTIWKPIGTLLALLQRVILFTLLYLLAGPIALLRRLLRTKRSPKGTFWVARDTRRTTDFLRQY